MSSPRVSSCQLKSRRGQHRRQDGLQTFRHVTSWFFTHPGCRSPRKFTGHGRCRQRASNSTRRHMSNISDSTSWLCTHPGFRNPRISKVSPRVTTRHGLSRRVTTQQVDGEESPQVTTRHDASWRATKRRGAASFTRQDVSRRVAMRHGPSRRAFVSMIH